MTGLLAAIGVSIVLAGCGGTPAMPRPVPGTGIQGRVTVGPSCPVERVNSPCPPRPMAATVVVRNSAGAPVTRFVSGADGGFKVDLLPGLYTLTGVTPGSSSLPRPIPVTVAVAAGSYATVDVEFDSGIR